MFLHVWESLKILFKQIIYFVGLASTTSGQQGSALDSPGPEERNTVSNPGLVDVWNYVVQ